MINRIGRRKFVGVLTAAVGALLVPFRTKPPRIPKILGYLPQVGHTMEGIKFSIPPRHADCEMGEVRPGLFTRAQVEAKSFPPRIDGHAPNLGNFGLYG